MAFSSVQKLRKMRGTNKGLNTRLAASLREVATMLAKKGPEELSQQEIRSLQRIREMLSARLYANSVTKGMRVLVSSAPKLKRGGKFVFDIKKTDL